MDVVYVTGNVRNMKFNVVLVCAFCSILLCFLTYVQFRNTDHSYAHNQRDFSHVEFMQSDLSTSGPDVWEVPPVEDSYTNQSSDTSFATRAGNITKYIFPIRQSIPKSVLSRLDRSTRNELFSRLENMTTERKHLVDVYEILRSMGYLSRLPDVINIGVKKSGTTALMFYLKSHPQLQTSIGGKEVHFFDWHYRNGLRWYESQMKLARSDQLVYEKTPRYFVTDPVPDRIRLDLGKDLRFLLCVRDPVSRLISDFHFSKQIRSTRQWQKLQTTESETRRFVQEFIKADGTVESRNEMISTSNYALHFKRWLQYYSRDQFLIIDNSDMVGDVVGTLRQIESFLGLQPFFGEGMFVRTATNATCLRKGTKGSCPRLISSNLLPKPNISTEVEQTLRDYYRPYNEEFEELTGRHFHWSEL